MTVLFLLRKVYTKTEIAIEWQAEKDLVGRAERGYNGCATKHNH